MYFRHIFQNKIPNNNNFNNAALKTTSGYTTSIKTKNMELQRQIVVIFGSDLLYNIKLNVYKKKYSV